LHKALFFGSFNPIHNGHIAVVTSTLQRTSADEIMVIVSPQSPFKQTIDLAPAHHRFKMTELALAENEKIHVSGIEFSLPLPSYTINTINSLKKKFPSDHFSVAMGSDNLIEFHKWKDYNEILKYCSIILYKRHEDSIPKFNLLQLQNLTVINAPLIDISAKEIRKLVKNKGDIEVYLPKVVAAYIRENHLYQ